MPLSKIAAAAGTPVYVYSAPTLRERYRALDHAFGDHPHAIHYALKANSTLAIARLIRELGGAADANSIWELELARKAGFAPADIVFTGVGRSRTELECAVPLGLKAINVESAGEIARVEAIAAAAGVVARVAVRVNPDIDAESHPHISTGLRVEQVRRANHWYAKSSCECSGAAAPRGSWQFTFTSARRSRRLNRFDEPRHSRRACPTSFVTPGYRWSTWISAAVSAFRTTDGRFRRRRNILRHS